MAYSWKFFRAGGFDQVKLETGADLANLDQLDQKLWVALACPTRGLEFDSRTLDLIDTDKDGRVRAPEIIAATKWITGLLKTPDELIKGAASLPLDAINDATPEGKQILSSAREILRNLGKADAKAIDLEDTADTAKIFAATNFNGDGIIPADASDSEATRAVIAEIIAIYGADKDRSGKSGINQAKADAFFAEVQAYSDWWKQASGDQTILPLGEATSAAAAALKAVRSKVDDFFARCQLAAFDARSIPAMNREEKEYFVMTVKELHLGSAEIVTLPLAQIAPGKALPLTEGVNPAWATALTALQTAAIQPLLGERTVLTEADWNAIKARLAPFETWTTSKVGVKVESLGLTRLHEILASPARVEIDALIAKDKALEPEANAIAVVEKLIRYNRDLYTLATNFVNFKNFYSRTTPAIFQAGRLYLDQRSCDLCLTVEDAGRHAVMAGLAGAYLAYCDCVRKSTGEKLSIVAIFSQGDDDNLMVGRNGVFYDRKGNDYDATITKILASPISLRQAFWSPYKKLVRMIEEQIAKRAASADADVNTNLSTAAQVTANADKSKPEAKKLDIGMIAALSVAFGSIGTALAYFLGLFKGVPPWQLPVIGLALMLMISGPSVILAYVKLRKRNLGPILDANGWAVNAKAKINVPFGTSLTGIAKLPPGSMVDISDRYAEKSSIWPKVLVVVLLLWWIWAFMDDMGILWRLTKTWDTPLGKPPASAGSTSGGSGATTSTNSTTGIAITNSVAK